jgi:hypothetical protein
VRGEQRLGLQRQFAEAVDQFFLQGVDVLGVSQLARRL